MRVLITGGNGFIGSEIAARLGSDGFQVVGLSKSLGPDKDVRNGFEKAIRADITEKENIFELLRGERFDAVVHCAGLAHQFGRVDENEFERVNVGGSENMAEAAAKFNAGHFILLSSTAVYGIGDEPFDENSVCRPGTFYARSKLNAESVCRKICEKNEIPLTIFRPAPVLGEKGVGNVPRLIDAIDRRRFLWVGNGENQKSLIYVGDVAEACRRLLREKKGSTQIYNLASKPVTMRRLVSIIAEKLNRPVPDIRMPVFVPQTVFNINSKTLKLKRIEALEKTFEKWLSEDRYMAGKIFADYGFEPETPVEEAVKKQCEWYLQAKNSRS